MHGEPWMFPEYLHGQTHAAEGTSRMAWSAAAALIAEAYRAGGRLFDGASCD